MEIQTLSLSKALSETLMEAKEGNLYVSVLHRKQGASARNFTAETTYNISQVHTQNWLLSQELTLLISAQY